MAKKALDDGHCCVIGLQSTGKARSKGAAKAAGFNNNNGGVFDEFVSTPNEDLKRIILMMFPLPPKPKGVIAPVFLNPVKDKEEAALSNNDTNGSSTDDTQGKRRSKRDRNPSSKKRKLSISDKNAHSKQIPWDEISLDLDVMESVENERLVNYRKAAEKVKKCKSLLVIFWSSQGTVLPNYHLTIHSTPHATSSSLTDPGAVDEFELPANPLDR